MKTVKELMGLVEAKAKKMKGADPCWDNYEMVGTKKKNGKEVPNCVPKTEEVVAEDSDYTSPKLGTVKANLMNTQKPTVQVQVFKHNTLRGDSYWVTKEVKTFKTMDQAQTYADRINKKDVAEEVEQVDELNKDTVYSYKKKSEKEEDEAHEKLEKEMKSGNARAANKTGKKIMNRLAGQERAEKRLNNEEVEQKKSTLPPHLQKLIKDKQLDKKPMTHSSKVKDVTPKGYGPNEEVEQVDELSVTTLGSYVNKSFNDITVKNKLANKHMAIASMHNKSNKPDAESKSIQNAMVLNALAKQRAAKAQKALGKVSGVTESMVGDWTSLKNKSGKTIHIKSNTNSPTRHTFDVHLDKNNPPIEKGRLNKRNIKLRHDAGEFDKHFNRDVAEDINVAFTEAVKKDEATSTKDVKKGEKLSGKQEPIKINPPLQQR